MKTLSLAIRKLHNIFPRLFVAGIIIPWVYCSVIYFKEWVYRILTGIKVIDKIPMGGDFSYFWIPARLALNGDPASVYDPAKLQAALKAFFGLQINVSWLYPPTFLLVLLPLAWFPYSTALATWLLFTLGLYLCVIKRIAPHPLAIFFALFFPATFINFGYGQNGFLSTALLGGGLLMAEKSPIKGGCILGVLTYKPHLSVLVFVALIAGRRWGVLAGFLTASLAMTLASMLVFGYHVWGIYLKAIMTGNLVHSDFVEWAQMTTFFSKLHIAGIGWPQSLVIQGIIMLAVATLVFAVWRQGASLMVRGSVLVLGTLLFSPYLFNYDLCLLALPLAWIAWDGYKTEWMRGERFFLFLCWLAPMFSFYNFRNSNIPIAPIFLILLLGMVFRRKNHWLGNENYLDSGKDS